MVGKSVVKIVPLNIFVLNGFLKRLAQILSWVKKVASSDRTIVLILFSYSFALLPLTPSGCYDYPIVEIATAFPNNAILWYWMPLNNLLIPNTP
jgi:hypothetical protein